MPDLVGLSHLSLSVPDMARAKTFWAEVMGFRVVMETPDFCFCVHPVTEIAISVKDHEGTVTGSFDETRVGLDHVALGVADRAELERWRDWLAENDVSQSEIVETEFGHHLNLRAPDNVAVELFAIRPQALEGMRAQLS
jgi:glyoxylase I family protein